LALSLSLNCSSLKLSPVTPISEPDVS